MRVVAVLLVVAAGLMALSVPALGDAPPDSIRFANCAGGSELVPKWRISVRTFDNYDGALLGVYRRLGECTDLGINIDADLDASDEESDMVWNYGDHQQAHGEGDNGGVSVALGAELRRWRHVTQRLSWYAGVRLTGEYSHDNTEFVDGELLDTGLAEFRESQEFRDLRFSVGLGTGVDVALMRHLSATFALFPISVSGVWSKATSTALWIKPGEPENEQRAVRETNHRFSLDTQLGAAVYLSVGF